MKDSEANVALIRHITRRIDEFFDDYRSLDFETVEEVQQGFARWLRQKETGTRIKQGQGMIVQEVPAEEIFGDGSATLAFVKLMDSGYVGVMWTPLLFDGPIPMPDELREDLVELLRFHADILKDRTLDKRMKECTGTTIGAA